MVSIAAEPTGVAGLAVAVMETLGGFGAALLVAIDNVFPPVPSELVLPLAGFAASQGTLTLLAAILWTTAGSLFGALITYGVGAALGRERTRALIVKVPLMKAADFDRTERWFERNGQKAVFLGRMVPVFRSLISLPAGVSRMPLWRFAALTAAGSALWNSALVVAGYVLGSSWGIVDRYVGWFQYAVLGLIAVAVVVFVTRRTRQRRAEG
jgi:membrane protein DedA with SNARE-associated domain